MTKKERARAARAMVTTIRGADDKEGEGGKAMVMATRMAGKGNEEGNGDGNKFSRQQRGQWRWQQEHWRWQQGWLESNSNEGNGDKGGG